ncbi:macrolide family glycosyltransferase [Streptomyces sp. NPDC058049]|uniref:macrolide family glycosyltransferase n=1 Tax=Streptomyces sp. NPDC058049 TaxID=3346314 RepID=UPI0036E11F6F
MSSAFASTGVAAPSPPSGGGRHIAVFNAPQPGHVTPTLAVVTELVARGHRVTYAITEDFAPQVKAAGADVVTYRLPSAAREASEDLMAGAAQAMQQNVRALPELMAAFADDTPDLVLYDLAAAGGRLLAAYWQVPAVLLAPTHLPYEGILSELYGVQDLSHMPGVGMLRMVLAAHGVTEPLEELLLAPRQAVAFFPRAFQRKADTVTAGSVTYAGPALGDRSYQGIWKPPQDGRPVLLVSLGTRYTHRPEFYRACIEAFADTDMHVVMTVGHSIDPAGLGPVPKTMEIHPSVPQLDVLARAAAFVTHGGMGSVMEAMAHGVPLVVVPQMTEQQANAHQVEHLSLGLHLPREQVTPQALRDSVQRVTTDPEIARGVAVLRQAIQEAGGTVAAADAIERALTRAQTH